MAPSASIVIPTRARLPYLEVALSLDRAAGRAAGAEVLVVDDAGPRGRGARAEPSASARATSPTRARWG